MRFLRQQAGVSGSAVARAMGVTRSYVSQLELGDAPWTPTLLAQYRQALATVKQQRGK
jgi:transcriptional regulator with XRE-family HTH domain